MREIKFRVWDKKTKKMRQLVNIVFNAGFGVEPNNNTIKLIWVKGKDIIEDKDIQIQREDNFELMQYTGLHDKNGKEIYEGDIVKYRDSIGQHIEKVIFDKGCFYAGMHCGSSTRVAPKLINTRITEVIGNIYDNPELLEKGAGE